jgi:two-component system phosphate regulon response regulator PhoB
MRAMGKPDTSPERGQSAAEAINLDFTGVFKLSELRIPPPAPPVPKAIPADILVGAGEIAAGNFYVNFARTRTRRRLERGAITILVVEDDVATRTLLHLLLGRAGYKTRQAGNGAEFIAAMNHKPLPDLLILDIHLPDVSGLKILTKIRAHPRLAGLPVILFTAHAGAHELAQGVALGADGFLSKPAKAPAVVAAVETVLGG